MKPKICFLLFIVLFFNANLPANGAEKLKPFPMEQVRLLPGPFKMAQDKDAAYLLCVEPDRLLAKFRTNAGLTPKAEHYDGWEKQTIAGHSLGHYLSAVSLMYASTGDERFKERSDYIVDELAQCQDAGKDGLVSAIEGVREKFAEVSQGNIRSAGFDLNGLWVPWYTQHKVFAGLLDAYRHCKNEKALDIVKKLGDWGIEITKDLTEEQFQTMLRCEFGGVNESYYELYAITKEEKYLKMGDRFYHHAIIDPLREGRDDLPGKHANTQIPKLVGLARRCEVHEDDISARKTVEYFWDRVVNHHSYVTGGNSMGEHFGAPDKLNDRLRDDTTETCNTYNMLKLTKMLYTWTGDAKYIDFYERALFNHILPSIDLSDDPNKLFTYFVPLRSGGFRTYSDPNHHWTCCHGTGMENHAMYNGMIYSHVQLDGRDVLYVNLLIPSTLDWKEKGLKFSILPDYSILVEAKGESLPFIEIRVPRNVHLVTTQGPRVMDDIPFVYDQYQFKKSRRGDSIIMQGKVTFTTLPPSRWEQGKIHFNLPFNANWKIETMPDNEDRIAFFRGPYLYAGNLGPIDKPVASEFDDTSGDKVRIPVIISDTKIPETMIDGKIHFQSCSCCLQVSKVSQYQLAAAKPDPVEMIPFYEASQRYAVYFDRFNEEQWSEKQAQYKAEQQRLARIAALTVDSFQPGEMQPERDHNFQSEKSFHGEHMGRKWRDARDGGFLEFDMKIEPKTPCRLELTYWGDDSGNREFDILIDGKKIATQKLERNAPGKFFSVDHEIETPANKDKIRVRLQGHLGKWAGGIFGAKIIKVE